jgi:hypothetical protein
VIMNRTAAPQDFWLPSRNAVAVHSP